MKIGFLARKGSVRDLVEAAKLNTLLWGGLHNPILPISDDHDQNLALLESVPVDVLHPIGQTEAISNVLKEFPAQRSPRHFERKILVEDWHTKKNTLAYLDSLNVIVRNYEKYFRGTPQEDKSETIALVQWSQEDNHANLFSLLFGNYAQEEFKLRDDFETAFLKGLRAHKIEIVPDEELPAEIAGKFAPLPFTQADLRSSSTNRLSEKGVFLGDPNSFDDLLFFWAVRASGIFLTFLPLDHIDRYRSYIQSTLDAFVEQQPTSPSALSSYLTLYHRGLKDDRVRDTIQSFQGEVPWSNHDISNTSLAYLLQRLPADYLTWDFTLGTVDNEGSAPRVTLNLPEKKFVPDTDREIDNQTVVVSIDELGNFEYPGYTLKPPYILKLHEFYSRNICFDPCKVRAEADGIGVLVDLQNAYESVSPLSYETVIQAMLELAGIKVQRSQAGRLAQRIIEQVGSLEGCRVFKFRGVRNLFRKLGTQDVIERSQAKKEIYEADLKDEKRLPEQTQRRHRLTNDDIFDYLLSHGFFRAGLELMCERCGLSNWLSLRDINDNWVCEYCGNSNLTSLHLRHRGDWKFRRSGLFGKDNSQEGAIPVLLTLLLFKRRFDIGSGSFLYTPSMNLQVDSTKLETDFFVTIYREGESIEVTIGECKDQGGAIDEKDAGNLELVRERLAEQGIKCYLTFAKTADEFTPEELELFRDYNSRDVPLILFTNRELEPYDLLDSLKEQDGPVTHPRSCADLHRNSVARYLSK